MLKTAHCTYFGMKQGKGLPIFAKTHDVICIIVWASTRGQEQQAAYYNFMFSLALISCLSSFDGKADVIFALSRQIAFNINKGDIVDTLLGPKRLLKIDAHFFF